MLSFSSAALTHPGLVRPTNEDSLLVTDRLVAVADGLGGHVAGEVASRIAVDRLRELATQSEVTTAGICATIRDVNARIRARSELDPACLGMATTLSGLALVRDERGPCCVVFNVGDSRVYRLRERRLQQVSVDHTDAAEQRHVLTRCLGWFADPRPAVRLLRPADGERFLVCSDGLNRELSNRVIARELLGHPRPGPAVSALLERALAAGGRDNVAVIVVNLEGADIEPEGGAD